MWDHPAHYGWEHHWVGNSRLSKKSEQAIGSKPLSHIPRQSPVHFLPIGSCLEFLSWLLSMVGWPQSINQLNHFLLQVAFGWNIFVTPMESQLGQETCLVSTFLSISILLFCRESSRSASIWLNVKLLLNSGFLKSRTEIPKVKLLQYKQPAHRFYNQEEDSLIGHVLLYMFPLFVDE